MGDIVEGMFADGLLDWWPDHELDEPRDTAVKCKHCGKTAWWHHTGVRWTLLNVDNTQHNCRAVAPASDFDDIS